MSRVPHGLLSLSLRARGERGTLLALVVAGMVAATALPATAAAHGLAGVVAGSHNGQAASGAAGTRAFEAGALGPRHALEHARARRGALAREARLARLTPAGRRRALARERIRSARFARVTAAVSGGPDDAGSWNVETPGASPFPIPNFAIHAALLPTGKVLTWGFPFSTSPGNPPNEGHASLWDPSRGYGADAFKDVSPPLIDVEGDGDLEPAPIYCTGESFLADGRLLLVGGNRSFPGGPGYPKDFAGMNRSFIFDPYRESWEEQPRTARGRWYPSQALLGDGRTVVLGGFTEDQPGGVYTDDLEVFTPAAPGRQGGIQKIDGAKRDVELYPHLFTLPNAKVLLAGPGANQFRRDSAILDPANWTWRDLPLASQNRVGGTAVLRPGGTGGSYRVTQIGGYDHYLSGDAPAVATTETIDAAEKSPRWVPDKPLSVPRSYHNTVLLPDGSMVTVGGGAGRVGPRGVYTPHADMSARQVELQDPATGEWRLGPAQLEDRTYHSTALLLPDGRVFSGGDNGNPTGASDTAEVYSPPYLFRGARPTITAAPAATTWGRSFTVGTPDADVSRAVLVAPSATTHGADMTQRQIDLRIAGRAAGGLTLDAPRNANMAPPGYYMLFLLNSRGVPSVARFVRLDAAPVARLKLLDTRLRAPAATGRLRVGVTASEAASVRLTARLQDSARGARTILAGVATQTFAAPGTKTVSLRLNAKARRVLRGARSVKISLVASARDTAGITGSGAAARTLRR